MYVCMYVCMYLVGLVDPTKYTVASNVAVKARERAHEKRKWVRTSLSEQENACGACKIEPGIVRATPDRASDRQRLVSSRSDLTLLAPIVED